MKREFLEGGRILTAHGVRGLVKVEHACDSAKVLASQKRVFFKTRNGEYIEKQVGSASVAGAYLLMEIEGIDSREAAIAERGRVIYLHRSDIPLKKGDMFLADMIGLPVYHNETGALLGEISDVSDATGRRIYTIKTPTGDVLLPGVPEFIKEIDSEGGMRVSPIPGFFDEADEV